MIHVFPILLSLCFHSINIHNSIINTNTTVYMLGYCFKIVQKNLRLENYFGELFLIVKKLIEDHTGIHCLNLSAEFRL